MPLRHEKQRTQLDRIIDDILFYEANIESVYLIGSEANGESSSNSDIDLVLVVKERIPADWIRELKEKHPILDVVVLDLNRIEEEITNSPSTYIHAINQILLNKKLVFGNDCVKNCSISKEHLINNQLYFPLFSYNKLLHENGINKDAGALNLIDKEDFLKLNFSKEFEFNDSNYFLYKELDTFILTICSFRLIFHGKFEFHTAGKKWFLSEYLKELKEDEFYFFIHEYHKFMSKRNSFIFDRKSTYLESEEFKTTIYKILSSYLNSMTMSKLSKEEEAQPVTDPEIEAAARISLMDDKEFGSKLRTVKISKERISKDIFDLKIEENGE